MIPVPNIIDVIPQTVNRILPRYNIEPEPGDSYDLVSQLGTPVYSNLQFKKVSGTSLDNTLDVGGQKPDSEVILRIDTVLITVTLVNDIIKTPIQGGRPVLEYIGQDNYMISIQGEIVGPYMNQFPHDDLSLLVELCNLKKTLPIASNFLSVFSIDYIAIERATFGEKPGSRNEIPFQIDCMSDYPLEFKLNATTVI